MIYSLEFHWKYFHCIYNVILEILKYPQYFSNIKQFIFGIFIYMMWLQETPSTVS